MRVGKEFIVFLKGVGSHAIRPSLRCAMLLENRPGGFPRLLTEIQDGSMTAICDVLRSADLDAPFLEAKVMHSGVDSFRAPLLEFVLHAAGLDLETQTDEATQGTTTTFAEHLADLYRKATGWLGWTPATALDATPAEIIEAVKGRAELLRLIFGTSDEDDDTTPEPVDLQRKFRAVFGSIGTVKPPRYDA
ncbi:hypothetical protein [Pseudogemmobacter sonorensis]|uniref:hypothetical protein n=1 Tax=Pseudogemmobacter sonorensis TaxID=2989681 RepID=UPI00367713D5